MKRILQFVVVGTVLGIILSLIFIEGVNWFPVEASQQSKNQFPLFIAITYISFVIFAVVIVAMGYSLWKFRQRGPSDLRDGDPTHGNTLLEIIWTAIPLVIVAVFGIWGAIVLDDNEAQAKGGRVITVIGYSFNFEYRYDSDGGFTRNDGLYLPVGEPITLHMITPLYTPGSGNKKLEVIHSFWVPEWGVKQDATPGVSGKRVGTTWVTPTRVGTYEVQCTELCGSGPRHHEVQEHPRVLEGALRDVARRRQEGGGRREAGRAGQPRPGGLQLLGLRRLPHVYAGQVGGYSRPEAR